MEKLKGKLAEWLVKQANRLINVPGSKYQFIDNYRYFDKDYLESLEQSCYIAGFNKFIGLEETAIQMQKITNQVIVREGDEIRTATEQDIEDIGKSLDNSKAI